MDAIYQTDDQYFGFFEGQDRELQVKKSQGIITSVFEVLQIVGIKQEGDR